MVTLHIGTDMPFIRSPEYRDSSTAVVIGIDIGATVSSASYAMLHPGRVSEVRNVNEFIGQEQSNLLTTVPSVVYYSKKGALIASGADISRLDKSATDWLRIRLLPPAYKPSPGRDDPVPMYLMINGTVINVWADFLRYLNESVHDFIKRKEVDGALVMSKATKTSTYVLTYPNQWEEPQRNQILEAAVLGGLVPDTPEGRSRVKFLSSGEASAHWCATGGMARFPTSHLYVNEDNLYGLREGGSLIICDAGYDMIEVSSFRIKSLGQLVLEKAAEAESRAAGFSFVTNNFYTWAFEQLNDTTYGSEEHLTKLEENFAMDAVYRFRDSSEPMNIEAGQPSAQDDSHHIKDGRLAIPGATVASFFEDSCREAANAIRNHVKTDQRPRISVTGVLSESAWFYSEIKRLLPDECDIYRFPQGGARGAADGCVISHVARLVYPEVLKDPYPAGVLVVSESLS